MNYLEKAVELIKSEIERSGPGVYHVQVYHDAWCSIYAGVSCNCDPDVELVKNSPALSAINN